jgi:hypothetical protein
MGQEEIPIEKLMAALKELNSRLEAIDINAEITMCGGASMSMVHGARNATKDIDARYKPKEIIDRLVIEIAEEFQLPDNWLNDKVTEKSAEIWPQQDFMQMSALIIKTVTAEYLLSMKLKAQRPKTKDMGDIVFLLRKLGISSMKKVEQTILPYFKTSYIPSPIKEAIKDALLAIKLDLKDVDEINHTLVRKGASFIKIDPAKNLGIIPPELRKMPPPMPEENPIELTIKEREALRTAAIDANMPLKDMNLLFEMIARDEMDYKSAMQFIAMYKLKN